MPIASTDGRGLSRLSSTSCRCFRRAYPVGSRSRRTSSSCCLLFRGVAPWLRRSDLNAVLGTCMDLDRGVPDVQGAVVSNARIRFSRRGHEVTIDQARQLVAICLQYLDRWHGDYAFDERDLSGIGHRYAALAHRRAVRAEKGRFAGNATSQDRRGSANLASGCGPGIGWWASTELAVTWWFTSRDPPTPRVVWRRSPRCLLRRTRSTFADTARCQRWIPQ